jgi:ribosomal protein S27AE
LEKTMGLYRRERQRVTEKLAEPDLFTQPPRVCPKPGCGGTFFISHEEGWQCFNCMKILYKASQSVSALPVIRRYRREKNR